MNKEFIRPKIFTETFIWLKNEKYVCIIMFSRVKFYEEWENQWNYETSLNYHGNWKPIRLNFFKIQWNLVWRQRTPPGHPPVQTLGEGKEDSAKEGRPSHTACICPGQKFSGVEITNRFPPTKTLKKAFSLVTLLFTLQDQ